MSNLACLLLNIKNELRRLKSEKNSKIWKPKNQLFCEEKAITSLRLNLFQQTKSLVETSGVALKVELKSKMVDLSPWQQKTFKH